jgi:hypothetical protein
MFLYQKWLSETLHNYITSPAPPSLRGRPLRLSPQQYGAALMQAYLGQASLAWVAEVAGIPLATLQAWRREPEFLLVMDWSKSLFSEAFRENLQLHDYTLTELVEIAGEFSLLEDSLRISVRTRLYHILRNLGERLISRNRAGIPLEKSDLRLFNRLLRFFVVLEHYCPSPARKCLREKFRPFALEVVGPLLQLPSWEEPELKYSRFYLCQLVAQDLKKIFANLPQPS